MFYIYVKITTLISHGKLYVYVTIMIKWQVNDAGDENAKNSNDSDLSSVYLIIYLFLSNNNTSN